LMFFLTRLTTLVIKLYRVSMVKSLDAIFNFDLIFPLFYHKLLLFFKMCFAQHRKANQSSHITMPLFLLFFSLGLLVVGFM
jgi:hypothetical protein